MRLLDRYVVGQFLRVFFGALLVFSVGAVALDFFSRIGHFMNDEKVAGTFAEDYSGLRKILLFYLAYLPFLLKEVLPFVTIAAGLFTLSGMLRGNEVFPVVAAGVSSRRLFLPLLLCGLAVSVGHMAFQETVVPALGRKQIALKRFFSGDRTTRVHNLAHLRDGRGTVTRAATYEFDDGSLTGVVVQRPWTEAGFDRWTAPRLVPRGDGWVAPDGGQVQPAGVDALPRPVAPGTVVDIGIRPDEVEALASKKGTNELSYTQLRTLARKFPQRRHLEVALHKQLARPLSSFVLLLVGVPLLLSAGRSVFLGGTLTFVLSATYYFLDIFCTSLGDRGDLPPEFAAYLPLACLFSFGVARLATVKT